ncbi:polarized growth protein (Boi2), putative [Talaromyces stipitatus ATCC 10500]|uniref:Polarized growth protein (Boi2), putative n=1 Tax=Talaromyces stipitatus (strain ATCC 10500 / CBS 375.48 / QM 6759 / NRRL 1006) TaxID=441959 RepID=B8MEC5_TALSN|nr:polarized growth protein (Boi2), putative [Talaromyces stipitatus ATCC 10500]EED16552.1 polarized growth protein (Boi2), putative [Talaromyces stipitatus ATCC 10500]
MAQTPLSRQAQPGDFLLVIHNFDARGPDELTLRRGEKVELVELDEGFNDGWYLGKHAATGKTGLFPGVYTTLPPRLNVRRPATASSTASETPSASDSAGAVSAEGVTASPIDMEGKGETTPQASRRASVAESPDAPLNSMEEVTSPVLKQPPQRSTSSPLPSSPSLATTIQRTISQTFGNHLKGGDSPVMNETLSVIDEHITDLNTPRHSVTQESKTVTDSGSEYSSHVGHRLSYINGHETDEEEGGHLTEEEVRRWDHIETARYLRSLGVDARHCDIFQEQEITGDVILEMGQEFLLMKEFDFGVMGRRLKTWHKIKALQEQVKGIQPQQSGSISSYFPPDEQERAASRAGQNSTFLPRIPSFSGDKRPTTSMAPPRRMSSILQGSPGSPSANSILGREVSGRPSAASIREFNHTRRHSSMDSSPNLSQGGIGHAKKGSFDRSWTMTGGHPPYANRPETAAETTDEDIMLQQSFLDKANTSLENPPRIAMPFETLDRGYFSGGEVETRRTRKLLRKRDSAGGSISHSRQSSYVDEQSVHRRHSRFGSSESIQKSMSRVSVASKAYHGSRVRSTGSQVIDPTATTLDGKVGSTPPSFSPFAGRNDMETTGRSSPMPFSHIRNVAPKFRRAVGLRTTSDSTNGVTTQEPTPPISPIKDFTPFGIGRTGSTTPSATSKSSERHSTDGSGKTVDGTMPFSVPRVPSKTGSKTKKHTSAYMRGLEKKSPQEQMVGCEFSGWMKKRSANLMTTWKPRLFVLRGRRLSYYYSENDTEERGLIDITAHRVLRADNDPLTALHATITGAKASPTSPEGSIMSPVDKASNRPDTAKSSDGPFIFKLVPPKSGTSRTVQFTRPTIHYFQVDSVQEGRLWMAALMKATIERDVSRPVETTNKQKTISLKQARMMNQRPPALMEPELPKIPQNKEVEPDEGDVDGGLKIQGLSLDKNGVGPFHDDDALAKEVGNEVDPEKDILAVPTDDLLSRPTDDISSTTS